MLFRSAGGWSCATDLAEYLALKGIPFRQAHEIVGKLVRTGLDANRPPQNWTLAELQEFSPSFEEDCLPLLRGTAGIRRREIIGGTGPSAVARALQEARIRMEGWRKP